MKFKSLGLALTLSVFLPLATTNAAKVANLGVSANADNLVLLWDPLSATDFDNADGYAIQWDDRESNTDITDSITFYVDGNVDDSSLRRNSFENDTSYYYRVYTYKINEDNVKVLGNGSDRLKFKVSFSNEVSTETIAVTDPVINTSSGTEVDTNDFEFGTLRKYPYDTFVDLFWSRPHEMASSDFDSFWLVLSEKSDMTDPILEAKVSSDATSVRLTGLVPEKNYYAQGHFKKNSDTFGASPIRSFKTITAVPRDNSTRQSRNIIKVEKRGISKLKVGGDSNTTNTTTTTTTVSTTATSTNQATIDKASQAEVQQKIKDLKKQISTLQSELRRWEKKIHNTSDSNSSATSSASRSSGGLSVRERLRLILESRRK